MVKLALLLIALAVLTTGCEYKVTAPDKDIACVVVKMSAAGEEPVCMIECAWSTTMVEWGFANATPVPCSWHGKTVERD